MGNDQNKKQIDVQIELNHSRIHSVKVINDAKKRYMQAVFVIQSSDYNKWKSDLQHAKLVSNYLLLPFNHQFESNAFCGNAGSVKVDYQNYPYLLIQQIQNRRGKKKRFQQTELWLLLFCLLDAQKDMRSGNSSKVGDIRPQNIFFNEQGAIKIANLLSWPKQTTNYQKFLQNQAVYLAPQDINLVSHSAADNVDNKLSQIFSIGLTILSAANITDFSPLYDTKSSTFNFQQFNRIVHEWKINQFYSDIFKATLSSLLEVDTDKRISEWELEPWIQQYRTQILAKNDFVITNPPKKIINEVQVIRSLYESFSYTHPTYSAIHSSLDGKKIVGVPLQGQRRLVQQKRLPPVSIIPGTSAAQSIYTPVQKSTLLSNYLVQGAPIGSSNPAYLNRTSVPVAENPVLSESIYTRNYSSQGANIPKMNFQYSSSPQRNAGNHEIQKSPQRLHKQQSNQPEIQQDKQLSKQQKDFTKKQ